MLSSTPQYTLFFYVPKPHTVAVCQAVFKAGAGTYPGGLYSEACFISSGIGSFRPNPGANPNIGKVGLVEQVEEDKVETICIGEETMRNTVKALKEAHPYEQLRSESYGLKIYEKKRYYLNHDLTQRRRHLKAQLGRASPFQPGNTGASAVYKGQVRIQ